MKDVTESTDILNNDLSLISNWAFNWKMLFNPDPNKPAQEVLFSRKMKAQSHPVISFNNIQVEKSPNQKHLGLILDEKLNFKQHIDSAISKVNKGIAVIKKLRYILPRKSLITTYKTFLRPLIDYGGIIYDQPSETLFIKSEASYLKTIFLVDKSILKFLSQVCFVYFCFFFKIFIIVRRRASFV